MWNEACGFMTESTGWTTTEVAGKRVDVFEPAERGRSAGVVLFLHGHDQRLLLGNSAFEAALEKQGLPCVCPSGGPCWWTDTPCAEFDGEVSPLAYLKESVVPFIEQRFDVRPPMIALCGVEMGGQGALQLAYRWGREFPSVAAISPAVDFHNWHGRGLPLDEMFASREWARQQTALLQLAPLNWPRNQLLLCDPDDGEWIESSERLASKLSSSGIPFESDFTTSCGDHAWDYYNHMADRAIAFLAERLEQESRRA